MTINTKLFPDARFPTDCLYELNWITVGSECYGLRIKSKPTQAQLNTLNKLKISYIVDRKGTKYEIMYNLKIRSDYE